MYPSNSFGSVSDARTESGSGMHIIGKKKRQSNKIVVPSNREMTDAESRSSKRNRVEVQRQTTEAESKSSRGSRRERQTQTTDAES
jgi:hypothetical protein